MRLSAMSRRRVTSGFTLVELMVVLFILLVLGSLAISGMGRQNTRTASAGLAREIYALANQARMAAASSGRQARITLRPPNPGAINVAPSPVAELQVALVTGDQLLAANQWGAIESQVFALQSTQMTGVDIGARMDVGINPIPRRNTIVQIIFYPNGMAQIVGAATTGATIFVADEIYRNPNRVLIFGRTGFSKVIDR